MIWGLVEFFDCFEGFWGGGVFVHGIFYAACVGFGVFF